MATFPPKDRSRDRTTFARKNKSTEYATDYDKESGTTMKKSDLQKRDGWVSPWPQGHENYTEAVKPKTTSD